LSEEEIQKMVQDAEANAEADKAAREKAEAMNEADTLLYTTEKSLKDYGDKVSAEDKAAIESASADLKKALEGDDVEDIKAKLEALKQASYKLAEEVYKAQSTEGQEAPGGDAGTASEGAESAESTESGPSGDDVEDADYEVVDEDK
jgi:molecular chaperone DnaK